MSASTATRPDTDAGMPNTAPTAAPLAIVTGASRGLGAATCETLLDRGYAVAAASRKPGTETERLTATHAGRFHWAPLDLTDSGTIRPWVAAVVKRFGTPRVLVNNAGLLHTDLFVTESRSTMTEAIDVNLVGPMLMTQAVARRMVGTGGAIVNISSINATRGHRGVASYSAAKAGLDGLTRALARELGPEGIRVNSVVPGYFDSTMTQDVTSENVARIAGRTPLGRIGTTDDLLGAIEFLISPAARFITGQLLVIDGGLTC